MTESQPSNPPYPQERTPEQDAAVRRRVLPLAFCGVVCAVAGLVLLLVRPPGVNHPPNVLAVNLSFCAMLMGAGIIFYAKKTPGTAAAKAIALAALLAGLVGPVIFAKQTVDWRKGTEGQELENVQAIAVAAGKYATDHGGAYPSGFGALLEGKYIEPEQLVSPFAGSGTEYLQKEKLALTTPEGRTAVATHSDYTYAGADLKAGIEKEAASKIIVVYKTEPVMRVHFAVGYVDGSGKYLTLEEAQTALAATNEARKGLGLPELKRPDAIERAEKGEVHQ